MERQKQQEAKKKKGLNANSLVANSASIVMYIDMNSFFASCEQQRNPELRGKPVGVITHNSPYSAVIAPSMEAKKFGVKTGMRLNDCRVLCPHIIPVLTHPAWYRKVHVFIMGVLRKYCDDIAAKSIDEAVMNFTSYRWVYKDFEEVARNIKRDIQQEYDYLKCSIGIAPNSYLAKIGTELQKPDGLVWITPENVDEHLSKLSLTDLPGIASRNERRLRMIGIKSPVEMRHASPSLLRKAFGGVVGSYWHARLNFAEVDLYSTGLNHTMSATRTVSREQRESLETMEAMLIALCTRLEQRMVKQKVFCKEVGFFIRYRDGTNWDIKIHLGQPVQDGMELRRYIKERVEAFGKQHNTAMLFGERIRGIGVYITGFVSSEALQYSLFDDRIKHDIARKAMYVLKDKYGKNIVRKGAEMFNPTVMKDAIGFGSVKDMVDDDGNLVNKYLLEDDGYE